MEQIFKIGAVSGASRAKRVLAAGGVRGRLTKTEGSVAGCTWGVAVADTAAVEAARLLRAAGVKYEVY